MELIVATTNKGKLLEIKEILKDFPIDLKSLDNFGKIPDVIEDGKTFDDNAFKKASFTSRVLGYPVIAEDSGLCVEALNFAPGVFSSRFAGEEASDLENNEKLLSLMKGKKNRNAFFQTVISISTPTGHALTYEGVCRGIISDKIVGDRGFGYDPLFYYPPLDKTFGELTSNEKNRISHRGVAFQELKKEFNQVLKWLEQNMPKLEKFKCENFAHNI